jgi:hypothetical protein
MRKWDESEGMRARARMRGASKGRMRDRGREGGREGGRSEGKRERDLRRPVCESAATEEDERQLHGEAHADNNGQSLGPEPAAGRRLRVWALEDID